MSPALLQQDKQQEIALFAKYAEAGEYQALTPGSCEAIITRCLALSGARPGALMLDLGCGSGTFTQLLQQRGYRVIGLDLCHALVAAGAARNGGIRFVIGDVEHLPVRSASVEGVFLSGLIHHLPDASLLAREVYRVLRPGGTFMAFDPNRCNPFVWLYRDPSSPFYSRVGVSPNERPVLASQVVQVFSRAGFAVSVDYLSIAFRRIASSALQWTLPLFNVLERCLFILPPCKAARAHVITAGVKPR